MFESTRRALRTVLRELALQGYEYVPIDEIVLEVYPRMMSSLLDQADRVPRDRIVHLRFEELERDPLGALERVYGSLALEGYPAARPRIAAYLDTVRDYRKTAHVFSSEGVLRVTERWQPFVTRFGYRPPDRERRAA